MGFVLDTSVLIEVEKGNEKIIQQIAVLKDAPDVELAITIFTFCEFYYGILGKNDKNKDRILERLEQYTILQTTYRSGLLFSEVLHQMLKKGLGIAQFDLFIAAVTMEKGDTLLTLDSDFKRVPGLKKVILEL